MLAEGGEGVFEAQKTVGRDLEVVEDQRPRRDQ